MQARLISHSNNFSLDYQHNSRHKSAQEAPNICLSGPLGADIEIEEDGVYSEMTPVRNTGSGWVFPLCPCMVSLFTISGHPCYKKAENCPSGREAFAPELTRRGQIQY